MGVSASASTCSPTTTTSRLACTRNTATLRRTTTCKSASDTQSADRGACHPERREGSVLPHHGFLARSEWQLPYRSAGVGMTSGVGRAGHGDHPRPYRLFCRTLPGYTGTAISACSSASAYLRLSHPEDQPWTPPAPRADALPYAAPARGSNSAVSEWSRWRRACRSPPTKARWRWRGYPQRAGTPARDP